MMMIKKIFNATMKPVLWCFVIIPGLFCSSLIDYSATNPELISQLPDHTLAFILGPFLSATAGFILFVRVTNYNWFTLLKILAMCCIIIVISYIAILSPEISYFVRIYSFYNLVTLFLVLIYDPFFSELIPNLLMDILSGLLSGL